MCSSDLDIMAKGSETGMKTFDQSLFDLFKSRKIDLQAALANADSSSDLEWKINFGGGMKELHGKEEKLEDLQFPAGPADLKG